MYRHGDVLLVAVAEIPIPAQKQPSVVLAWGEITGHSHRIAESSAAEVLQSNGEMFLHAIAPQATLVHEEHKPIVLTRGFYRVWFQREYSPQAIRRVVD